MEKIYYSYITVRLPTDLLEKLDNRGKKIGQSRNKIVVAALEMLLNDTEKVDNSGSNKER